MGTVCFKVHGDFLTGFVRDRMFEAGWQEGLRTLVTGLHDFTFDSAVAVLSGAKRLEGVNRLDLVDEDPEVRANVERKLNWKHAGTVFDGTNYYRPYAMVDNWGYNDLPRDLDLYPHEELGDPLKRQKNGYLRSRHYTDDMKRDKIRLLTVENEKVFVLWQIVGDVPVWMQRFNSADWQGALDAYLSVDGCTLEKRGHFQWYGNDPDTMYMSGVWRAVSEEIAAGYLPPQMPPMPDPDDQLNGECGWLIPDGRFFACSYYGHIALAETLIHHLKLENTEPSILAFGSEQQAEKLGWVKIGYYMLQGRKHVLVQHRTERLTRKQRDTLIDWHHKHNEEFPYWWDEHQPL